MRMKLATAAVAILALIASHPSKAQGVPTIDATAIANLKQEVNLLGQELTTVTNIMKQTQSMVNAIGQPVANLINTPAMLASFQNFSWYTPSAMSPVLSSVQGLAWDSPTNARNSTQSLFYSNNSLSSSTTSPSFDNQNSIQQRRQAAVRDAATNAWTIVQQYRQTLSQMQADITRLTSEANGQTVSQVEQANADIMLTLLKYQVAQSNLTAALTQLEAAQAIAADPSYTISTSTTATN